MENNKMNRKEALLKTLIKEEVKKQLIIRRLNEAKNDMKKWEVGMWVQYEMPNGKMHQTQLESEIEPGIWVPKLYGDHRIDASLPQNELWSQLQIPVKVSSQKLAISGPTRNLKEALVLYKKIVQAIFDKKFDMKNDPKYNWSAIDIGGKVVDLVYVDYKSELASIEWSADIHHNGRASTVPVGNIQVKSLDPKTGEVDTTNVQLKARLIS